MCTRLHEIHVNTTSMREGKSEQKHNQPTNTFTTKVCTWTLHQIDANRSDMIGKLEGQGMKKCVFSEMGDPPDHTLEGRYKLHDQHDTELVAASSNTEQRLAGFGGLAPAGPRKRNPRYPAGRLLGAARPRPIAAHPQGRRKCCPNSGSTWVSCPFQGGWRQTAAGGNHHLYSVSAFPTVPGRAALFQNLKTGEGGKLLQNKYPAKK